MSSSTQTVNTSAFDSLKANMDALRKAGARSKQAAEYFKSVDTLVLQLRGGVRVKESESLGTFGFKTQTAEGQWVSAEAKCKEKRLQLFRWADVLDMSGSKPVIVDSVLVALNVRIYEDSRGNTVGISTKNSRFNPNVFQGRELVRAHGHLNDWTRTDTRTGEVITTKVFNANGLGLYSKPSQFERRQQEALAQLPDMSDLPMDEGEGQHE